MDPCRIELVEHHDLQFWTRELRCSAKHLLDAIRSVGVDPRDVGNYLEMRRAVLRGQERNAAEAQSHATAYAP
jgi:hypothetical protein